jgi:hypothetical protein
MTSPDFESVKKRFTGLGEPHPTRDWLVLLGCAALVLVGMVVWSVWTFQRVVDGEVIDARAVAPMTQDDRVPSLLDRVRALYELRAAEAQKYGTGVYPYADPSQP